MKSTLRIGAWGGTHAQTPEAILAPKEIGLHA
jgi:hypothetical protein